MTNTPRTVAVEATKMFSLENFTDSVERFVELTAGLLTIFSGEIISPFSVVEVSMFRICVQRDRNQ